jgi:A/G-specific adenine glycosylase
MALVRDADGPVSRRALARAWPEPGQRDRCLESLLVDGLLGRSAGGYALPG